MRHPGLALALAGVLSFVATGPAAPNHVVMHGGPFGGVVIQLLAHPQEPDTLYLAAFGSGVYKTVDGGRHWTTASRGLDDPMVLALAVDPIAPRTLYAGTDSGVFVSRDGAATWSRTGSAIAGRNVRSLAVVPTRPTVLYAASDQGVLWSWDQGRGWASRSDGLEARDIRVVRLDPIRSGRLYAGGFGGVYRSEDGGRRWEARNEGLADRRVRALVLDPTRPGVLYAGTAGGGVFATEDAGGRWTALSAGLRNLTVLSLLATPDGGRFAGTVGGVHRWDAGAAAWRVVGEDILTLTVTFVATSPHRPATVYAGTGGLVFVSEDRGQHWQELAVSVTGPAGPRSSAVASPGPVPASHVERR